MKELKAANIKLKTILSHTSKSSMYSPYREGPGASGKIIGGPGPFPFMAVQASILHMHRLVEHPSLLNITNPDIDCFTIGAKREIGVSRYIFTIAAENRCVEGRVIRGLLLY